MNPKSASTLRRCWYLWSRHRPNQSYEGYSWDCEGEGYTIQVAVYTVCVVDAAYRLQVVAGVIRDVLHVGHAFGDHTLKSPILKGVGMPVRLGTFVWDKPLHRVAASLQTQRSRCTACDSVNLDKLRFGLQHYGSSFCRPYHPRRSQQHSFLYTLPPELNRELSAQGVAKSESFARSRFPSKHFSFPACRFYLQRGRLQAPLISNSLGRNTILNISIPIHTLTSAARVTAARGDQKMMILWYKSSWVPAIAISDL